MDIKHCNTCKKEKIHSEFHIRAASPDGLSAKCKSCASEYDKTRANLPHRVAARAAYRNTENGKISVSKAKKKYDSSEKKLACIQRHRAKHPKKYKARQAVGNAIRDGVLVRGDCEVCGDQKTHGHHDDYNKPLDVRWLCTTHHAAWHKENKPID